MLLISSARRSQSLTGNITQQPVGNISGGAVAPAGTCGCCGVRTSLDLGDITWTLESPDPFVETIQGTNFFVDYWTFLDGGNELPTIEDGGFSLGWSLGDLQSTEYVAYLDYSSPLLGCVPTVVVIFGFQAGSPGDIVGPGEIRVTADGQGTASIIEIDGDSASATFGGYGQFFSLSRPGVIVSSCVGEYGTGQNTVSVTEQNAIVGRNT